MSSAVPAPLDKSRQAVQRMFAAIAPRYDRANHLLSLRVDVAWRRGVVRLLLPSPGLVLDVASGTGDLSRDLERRGGHRVIGADFTFEMLLEGRAKLTARQVGADALALPFRSGRFDAVTVAFGIRNFADPAAGLREILRVLKPGGVIGILEFSTPFTPLDLIFGLYFRRVLPWLGGVVTGSRAPYEYLPQSVAQFPQKEAFLAMMQTSGFESLTMRSFTAGIATFYRGVKG